MVVQVGSHRRHVAHHRDAHVLQMLRRAQPGQQQQLRRAIGAAGDDHLAARARGAAALRGVWYSTPTARLFSISTRVAWAPVWTTRLARPRAGSR